MNHALPQGFRYAGAACGLKSDPKKLDISLIVCNHDCVAAGMYTTNLVHAASVATNRKRTPSRTCRAVVTNSGNANACTGEEGLRNNLKMAELAADACRCKPEQVLVMSTGIIGVQLNMEKVAAGIADAGQKLQASEEGLMDALRGMMTTDKFPKIASREVNVAGESIRVTGIAKGAGMIAPNMATMLGVLMTDAKLTPEAAQSLLQHATDQSFHCISVDGHTSTNDTLLLLASGDAVEQPLTGEAFEQLKQAVTDLSIELAKMIPDDGEGATHCITVEVAGCASRTDALQIARAVGDSPLVKTAMTGADPNWGRIVSAAGYAGVAFDPAKLELRINGIPVYRNEVPLDFDAANVSDSIRSHREVILKLTFSEGDAAARIWTSDLTVDYVTFNSEYTT